MTNTTINWRFIASQIIQKDCVPVISNEVTNRAVFNHDEAIIDWADAIEYPLNDRSNLTRVAQFRSVSKNDPTQAKEEYLEFIKRKLFAQAWHEPDANLHYLKRLERELPTLTVSQLAIERLQIPDFQAEPDNMLLHLAQLDLPIYITTNHHRFIEAALHTVGKHPRTQVYSWREGLDEQIPAQYRVDLNYEPTSQDPLVYHVHGIDDQEDSLVLTEDDHLEFLVNVIRDFSKTDVIPSSVRYAFSQKLLILLGYNLHRWDLRVILQGLIRNKPRRPQSYAIQLVVDNGNHVKDPAQYQDYLQKYFSQAKFDIYPGQPNEFVKKVYDECLRIA